MELYVLLIAWLQAGKTCMFHRLVDITSGRTEPSAALASALRIYVETLNIKEACIYREN